MIKEGHKIQHVRAASFISEMADQFNLVGTQTNGGARISMIIGRDQMDITQETLREVSPGSFQAQTEPEDLVMTRYVFANISMPVETAKALMIALGTAISQLEDTAQASQTNG